MRKGLALALAVVLGACAEHESVSNVRTEVSFSQVPDTRSLNLDAAFTALERSVPSFGGLSVEKDGRIRLHLRGEVDVNRATEIVGRFLTSRGGVAGKQIYEWNVVPASFTWSQLLVARDRLRSLAGRPDFAMLDVDEAINRVVLAVSTEAGRADVLSRIGRLGLPPGIVEVTVAPVPRPLRELTDSIRPMPGGVAVGWESSTTGGGCSLGFNVRRPNDSNTYMLINSHCSRIRATTTDSTRYYQPVGSQQIGVEAYDPPYFHNSQNAACPLIEGTSTSYDCRYSDALLARYTTAVYNFGYVARTQSSGTASGSTTFDDPWLDGVSYIPATQTPYSGQQLNKIGVTTGWTTGTVTNTCFTSGVGGTGNGNIRYLCQYQVGAGAFQGDSGSPVVIHAYFGQYAEAVGVLWGGWSTTYGDSFNAFVFSPLSGIHTDMGVTLTYY